MLTLTPSARDVRVMARMATVSPVDATALTEEAGADSTFDRAGAGAADRVANATGGAGLDASLTGVSLSGCASNSATVSS